jgi:23S rRNA (uridine2552-2'-O)-methyltransferase
MARLSSSSQRWRQRQAKDPFVERAVREGWRSRAVFKLEEIDRREHLLRRNEVVVDLGAAPGGWSQYAARKTGPGGRVVAIDLLPMEPIPDVEFLEADFTADSTLESLREALGGQQVGLVMSDMAPNISGNAAIDQPRSMGLAELAIEFAAEALAPGGDFLVKLFQGEGFMEFVADARRRFERVKLVKPKASRSQSRETYLLARQYRIV